LRGHLRQQKIRKQRLQRHLRILSRLEPVEAEGINGIKADRVDFRRFSWNLGF
jgi:hypothetical protein